MYDNEPIRHDANRKGVTVWANMMKGVRDVASENVEKHF